MSADGPAVAMTDASPDKSQEQRLCTDSERRSSHGRRAASNVAGGEDGGEAALGGTSGGGGGDGLAGNGAGGRHGEGRRDDGGWCEKERVRIGRSFEATVTRRPTPPTCLPRGGGLTVASFN